MGHPEKAVCGHRQISFPKSVRTKAHRQLIGEIFGEGWWQGVEIPQHCPVPWRWKESFNRNSASNCPSQPCAGLPPTGVFCGMKSFLICEAR